MRAICKTVTVILGVSRSKAPWKKHSNSQTQSQRVMDEVLMQSSQVGAHKVARGNKGSGVESVVPNLDHPVVVDVMQEESIGTRIVHEAWLEKSIVGLSISDPTNSRFPLVEQDSQEIALVQSALPNPLVDNLPGTLGLTLLTKAWKRLARAVGKVTKDNDVGSVFTTMENNVNSGKRRTSIDLKEQMESKKHCMDLYGGKKEQNFEMMVARQHH